MDEELLTQYVSAYEYLASIPNPDRETRLEMDDIIGFLSLYFTQFDIAKMLKGAH